MKKLILVLAVLALAAPALAGDPTLKASQVGDTNEVVITYDVNETPDGNLFRAFALLVSVDGDATVGTPYGFDPNYYINPGSIVITGGSVTNYGTPIAAQDSNSFTLEMGSLYASNDPCEGHRTAPPKTGVVCKFRITNETSCWVTIAADGTRGGCVMEDTEGTFNVETIGGEVNLQPACWGWAHQCQGDMDNDAGQDVDIDDFYLFADSYGKSDGQAGYNECANLDHEGDDCDIDDFYIFADNYGTSPSTVCP